MSQRYRIFQTEETINFSEITFKKSVVDVVRLWKSTHRDNMYLFAEDTYSTFDSALRRNGVSPKGVFLRADEGKRVIRFFKERGMKLGLKFDVEEDFEEINALDQLFLQQEANIDEIMELYDLVCEDIALPSGFTFLDNHKIYYQYHVGGTLLVEHLFRSEGNEDELAREFVADMFQALGSPIEGWEEIELVQTPTAPHPLKGSRALLEFLFKHSGTLAKEMLNIDDEAYDKMKAHWLSDAKQYEEKQIYV